MSEEKVDDLQAQLLMLQGKNTEMELSLKRNGVGIDSASVMLSRLALLAETLLGPAEGPKATKARLDYEIGFQQRIGGMMQDIETQVRMARLTQGVQGFDPRKNGGPRG